MMGLFGLSFNPGNAAQTVAMGLQGRVRGEKMRRQAERDAIMNDYYQSRIDASKVPKASTWKDPNTGIMYNMVKDAQGQVSVGSVAATPGETADVSTRTVGGGLSNTTTKTKGPTGTNTTIVDVLPGSVEDSYNTQGQRQRKTTGTVGGQTTTGVEILTGGERPRSQGEVRTEGHRERAESRSIESAKRAQTKFDERHDLTPEEIKKNERAAAREKRQAAIFDGTIPETLPKKKAKFEKMITEIQVLKDTPGEEGWLWDDPDTPPDPLLLEQRDYQIGEIIRLGKDIGADVSEYERLQRQYALEAQGRSPQDAALDVSVEVLGQVYDPSFLDDDESGDL